MSPEFQRQCTNRIGGVSPDRSVHNTGVGGLAGNVLQPDAGQEAVVLFPTCPPGRGEADCPAQCGWASANQLEAQPSGGEAGFCSQ